MEIGEPTVVARLPRAGLSGDGRTKFCQVYGIRDGQSKKRQEICAAVDGNSLNIFEVVNGRNLASWPIPPDSAFLCNPYSERIQLTKHSSARRSWCAVRRRGEVSVQCYSQLQTSSETSNLTTSHALVDKTSVVNIVPIHNASRDVLVLQENGALTALSHSGSAPVFQVSLFDSKDCRILAAECLTSEEARLSVLKSRHDLAVDITDDTVLIVGAYETEQPKDLHVAVWKLDPKKFPRQDRNTIEPLIVHSIGQQFSQSNAKRTDVKFSAPGKLEVSSAISATVFDLTKIVPQKMTERRHVVSDRLSTLELNNNICMYLNSAKIQICNTAFRSVLASLDISNSTLKRKRGTEGGNHLSLIAYFSKLRRVVACNGIQLLVIDLQSKDQALNLFKHSSLLVGNILRGTEKPDRRNRITPEHSYAIGNPPREPTIQNWSLISQELDALAEKKDSSRFEDLFMKTFELQKPKDLNTSKVPESKIAYLLSKVFTINRFEGLHSSKRLQMVLCPMELLKGCISNGLLEEHRIAQAINDGTNITASALVHTLLDAEPEIELVNYYIQHSPFLQIDALNLVIRIVIRKALDQSNEDALVRLNDHGIPKRDTNQQQTINDSHPDELNADSAATRCLAHALRRLACTGPSVVSKSMRTLDQKSVLALIQFLRQQLFLGGYSRLGQSHRYPSPPVSDVEEEGKPSNPNPQITLSGIIILLNGCIDAVGPVGILGSAEHEEFVQKMIPELLSEISSTVHAVEDSTFLQGLLRETLRYAESVERQPFEVRNRVENEPSAESPKKGQIVTLYTEPESPIDGSSLKSSLPLSLKAEEDIDRYKVRKGGQSHQRSAREIGMLRDRLRSSYSFERLVL